MAHTAEGVQPLALPNRPGRRGIGVTRGDNNDEVATNTGKTVKEKARGIQIGLDRVGLGGRGVCKSPCFRQDHWDFMPQKVTTSVNKSEDHQLGR